MLNGKFYTGLTEKMMNRGPNGIDRQRTNFYVPEEENSPSIHEYSPSRKLQGRRPSSRESSSRTSSISHDSQNSFFDDVNTRDLVRKQQASKIQFYDYDKTYEAPSRTITPSSVGRNLSRESPEADLSHRKLETLKSRIEFYDYVDEGAPAKTSTPKQHRDSAGQLPLPRESEARPANKSRDSNFVQDTYYAPGENNSRTDGRTNGGAINHSTAEGQQYQQQQPQPPVTRRVPIEIKRPIQEKSRIPENGSTRVTSVPVLKKQLSTSVIDLSTLDLGDPELEELKKLKPPTKNDIHKKLATFQTEVRVANHSNSDNIYRANRSVDSYDSPPPRSQVRRPAAAVVAEPPNEARRNAHRHLQSSFSFGAAGASPQPSESTRRANSIRDTAVCRVGVGLPDL